MDRQRCEGCRWFLRYTGQTVGQCRRYPPTQNTDAGWLEVDEFDWCGEYADKNGTSRETERQERVRQFALAIVQGWYASDNNIGPDFPQDAWQRARTIVEAENQK